MWLWPIITYGPVPSNCQIVWLKETVHLLSPQTYETFIDLQFRSGAPTAPTGFHLPLLPSGPGGVRESAPRGTRPSLP